MSGKAAIIAVLLAPTASIARHDDHRTDANTVRYLAMQPLTSRKGGASRGRRKGIYTFDGDTLMICDNAPNLEKARPAAFGTKSESGYVLITFKRAMP
jgi:hypothetical protein